MFSYSFELPTLMILAIILGFYFSRPRLPIRRNLNFVNMILIETLTILIDVAATEMDNDYMSYSIALVSLLNMAYFVVFFVRAYVMYLFSVSVMRDSLQNDTLAKHLIRLPLYLGILLSVLSPVIGSSGFPYVIFYIDESGYHSGSFYDFLYVCGFFYVLMSFIAMLMYGRNLRRRREKYGILVYNLILFMALVIRMSLPKYLIMDTLILMAILVVFLAFGNPEFFLDLRGAAFNRLALSEHLEEDRIRGRFISFGVVINDYHEMRDIYGSSQVEEGLVMIARYLKRLFRGGIVFYVRKGRFVV
ncbi:MAG: hypothetical protein IKT17_02965, partial [Lachnospiraceae bacterium]|nr:hypothetical protein [Lachnospiraceae bacterium]